MNRLQRADLLQVEQGAAGEGGGSVEDAEGEDGGGLQSLTFCLPLYPYVGIESCLTGFFLMVVSTCN